MGSLHGTCCLKKDASWSPASSFLVLWRSSKLRVASSKLVSTMARLKYCRMKKKRTCYFLIFFEGATWATIHQSQPDLQKSRKKMRIVRQTKAGEQSCDTWRGNHRCFTPLFFGGWDVVGLVGHATKCQRKIAILPSQIEMGIWWDVPKNNYWGANHQEVKRLYRLFIILQRCGLKPPSRGIPKIIQHLGVG